MAANCSRPAYAYSLSGRLMDQIISCVDEVSFCHKSPGQYFLFPFSLQLFQTCPFRIRYLFFHFSAPLLICASAPAFCSADRFFSSIIVIVIFCEILRKVRIICDVGKGTEAALSYTCKWSRAFCLNVASGIFNALEACDAVTSPAPHLRVYS